MTHNQLARVGKYKSAFVRAVLQHIDDLNNHPDTSGHALYGVFKKMIKYPRSVLPARVLSDGLQNETMRGIPGAPARPRWALSGLPECVLWPLPSNTAKCLRLHPILRTSPRILAERFLAFHARDRAASNKFPQQIIGDGFDFARLQG